MLVNPTNTILMRFTSRPYDVTRLGGLSYLKITSKCSAKARIWKFRLKVTKLRHFCVIYSFYRLIARGPFIELDNVISAPRLSAEEHSAEWRSLEPQIKHKISSAECRSTWNSLCWMSWHRSLSLSFSLPLSLYELGVTPISKPMLQNHYLSSYLRPDKLECLYLANILIQV